MPSALLMPETLSAHLGPSRFIWPRCSMRSTIATPLRRRSHYRFVAFIATNTQPIRYTATERDDADLASTAADDGATIDGRLVPAGGTGAAAISSSIRSTCRHRHRSPIRGSHAAFDLRRPRRFYR